jgi:hypothetical protein
MYPGPFTRVLLLARLLIDRIRRSQDIRFARIACQAGRLFIPQKEILDCTHKYVERFCITKGSGFRLRNYDPGDTCGLNMGKSEAGLPS